MSLPLGSLLFTQPSLNSLPRRPAGRPGPLEVVAPQPARDVHYLADKIKPGHFFGFHGFGGKLIRIHAAPGYLGLGITGTVASGMSGYSCSFLQKSSIFLSLKVWMEAPEGSSNSHRRSAKRLGSHSFSRVRTSALEPPFLWWMNHLTQLFRWFGLG